MGPKTTIWAHIRDSLHVRTHYCSQYSAVIHSTKTLSLLKAFLSYTGKREAQDLVLRFLGSSSYKGKSEQVCRLH
jgi:hypothetical protein